MRAPFVLRLIWVFGLCAALGLGCSEGEPGEAGDAAEVGASETAAAPEDAPPRSNGRSVAGRLEDASTAARVKKALVEERRLRSYDFEPEVVGGRLTLRGEVETAEQRTLAVEVAREVRGVRELVNAVEAPGAPPPDLAQAEPPLPPAEEEAEFAAGEEAPATAEEEEEEEEEEDEAETATYHTVQSGESLWVISRRYNVSIDEIKRLNNISSNNLRPGQELRVK